MCKYALTHRAGIIDSRGSDVRAACQQHVQQEGVRGEHGLVAVTDVIALTLAQQQADDIQRERAVADLRTRVH